MKTEHITKETQDYTNLGYGLITTYTKTYRKDGEYYGETIWYTYTVNGVESKRYWRRSNACKGMYKAAA